MGNQWDEEEVKENSREWKQNGRGIKKKERVFRR